MRADNYLVPGKVSNNRFQTTVLVVTYVKRGREMPKDCINREKEKLVHACIDL